MLDPYRFCASWTVSLGDNGFVVEIDAVEEIRQRLAAYEPRLLPETGGKRAAVLVPLYQHRDEIHVVFTKRTDLVQSHKGEISFPGGARDPEDADLIATALRESEEEIGLLAEHIEVIGQLDDIVTISDYHVSVYVGRLHSHPAPYVWQPQAAEVAEVIEVPLPHLRSPECPRRGAATTQRRARDHGRLHVAGAHRLGRHRPHAAQFSQRDGRLIDAHDPRPPR